MSKLEPWEQMCTEDSEWDGESSTGGEVWGQGDGRRQDHQSLAFSFIFLIGTFVSPIANNDAEMSPLRHLGPQGSHRVSAWAQLRSPLALFKTIVTGTRREPLALTNLRNICDPGKAQLAPESTRKPELSKWVNAYVSKKHERRPTIKCNSMLASLNINPIYHGMWVRFIRSVTPWNRASLVYIWPSESALM